MSRRREGGMSAAVRTSSFGGVHVDSSGDVVTEPGSNGTIRTLRLDRTFVVRLDIPDEEGRILFRSHDRVRAHRFAYLTSQSNPNHTVTLIENPGWGRKLVEQIVRAA